MKLNNIVSLRVNMLSYIDNEEEKVWNWGLKNQFSEGELAKYLYEARLNSISRFLSSFLREFSTEETFQKANFANNSVITNYIKENNIYVEKVAKIPYFTEEKTALIIFIKKEYTLKRFLIEEFPVLIKDNEVVTIQSTDTLVDVFKNISILKNYYIDKMREDLRISNAQFFISILLRLKNLTCDSKIYEDILSGNYNGDKNELLTFFEQWCINGHLMHPTPKSKNGLTLDDVVKYAPEAKSSFKLELVAVKKNLAIYNSNMNITYDDYMKAIYRSDYQKLKNTFRELDLSWEDYYVIPTHPWQYSYIISHDIEVLNNRTLNSKDLFKINSNVTVEGKALISFRSLLLEGKDKFIKLPLELQITSSRRHLSTRASHHAVYISKILSTIKQNNNLSDKFEFQNEEVSVHISKYISAIYRESINDFAQGNNIVMPAAAFYEKSPVNGNKTILDDILELYRKANNFSTIEKAALKFFEQYTKLLTGDVIKLLTVYGIALEPHLQNSIIVLKNFSPEKIIIRDGEAINVCLDRLKINFPDHEFFKNSWNVIDGPNDCQKVIMHALIVSNIGQLIYYICEKYAVYEYDLWNTAKEILKSNFQVIKQTKYAANAIEDENYLFQDYIISKSLFKMKIENKSGNEFLYVKFNNPLHN